LGLTSKGELFYGVNKKHVPVRDYGFTPHLFVPCGYKDNVVIFSVICLMEYCGVYIVPSNGRWDVFCIEERSRVLFLTINEARELCDFTNTGYELTGYKETHEGSLQHYSGQKNYIYL
jgi:hypothetical protein